MSLFPRAFTQELSPLFRMVDDYAALARHFDNGFTSSGNNTLSQLRSFQPRFDVSETAEGYTLHGELPGIDPKDVQIEWSDGNTLTISGRTEHRSTTGTVESEDTETGSHYEKPSVEDEAGQKEATAEGSKQSQTEQSQAEHQTSSELTQTNTTQDVAKQSNQPKYWVSERSVGQFHRSFSFPTLVDQDNVKASLKNGILEVTVPKAAKPQKKRIEIQ
jgi:HSP20 family molecular chaperone IbpA